MSRFANNALLGGGVRVKVLIREQRKIKRRSKALLSLCWQSWTSLPVGIHACLTSEVVIVHRERPCQALGVRHFSENQNWFNPVGLI